jgi:Spy/CpxP family protein refolding chaperone
MNEKQTEKTTQKSRWRRWLVFGIPAIAVSAVLLPVAAAWNGWLDNGHCFRRHGQFQLSNDDFKQHMERHLSMAFDMLDATDEQRSAIRKIVEESSDEVVELHQKGHALHQAFSQALLADPVDRERIEGLRGELQSLTDQISELAIEQLSAISEQLTPKQREKVRYYIGAE